MLESDQTGGFFSPATILSFHTMHVGTYVKLALLVTTRIDAEEALVSAAIEFLERMRKVGVVSDMKELVELRRHAWFSYVHLERGKVGNNDVSVFS